jgi:catechol 2,3-dioxygenase-like lactoylglutathione lyase family enzyme
MTIRFARPTNDLPRALDFYRQILGFDVLASFEDHDGFDGTMLGKAGASWHLELTFERGGKAIPTPSPEHLLVLYLGDREFAALRDRALSAGVPFLSSHNPYWGRIGAITFADPDGYRIVLVPGLWHR